MANGNPPIPPLISDLATYLRPIALSTASARVLPDCSVTPLSQYDICNITMSIHDRAASFVDEFTLQEKVNASIFDMPGIPRLGLPHMNLWNEGLHGLANAIGTHFNDEGEFSHATSFALPILVSAAFDDELVYTVADTISTETRAYGNNGYAGLDLWTPNVNPFRDPRWGRGLETPGEDVFRVSEYAKAVIRGFQGPEDEPHIKVVATCKHAAGNDIENVGSADEITRYNHDAKISLQDQADYYMRPFEACTRDAKADSLMCAYNAVNGIPQCADQWMMQTLIRDYWGWNWTGTYITSDCFALDTIQHPTQGHNYTTNVDDTLSISLRAGTDTECGVVRLEFLEQTLKKDPSLEQDLDVALIRVFESLIKVGYFDPVEDQSYRSIGWKDVNTPKTQKLAVDSAAAGMTLLKNDKETLPIKKPDSGKLSVALVGDWANATLQMLGGYFGPPPFYVSPLDALAAEEGVDVKYVLGLSDREGIEEAARASDIVLYVGGLDISNEHEMKDRSSLAWNTTQTEVIQTLADLTTTFVLVQTGGGQIDDSPWLENSGVSSILWIGYPGQAGGQAMCDVLFGRHAPAGRLPITQYPASFAADVPATLQGIRPDPSQGNPGHTYQWYNGTAVLPFGFGLHYTTFDVRLGCGGLPRKTLDISEVIDRCAHSGHRHLDQCTLGDFTIAVKNSGDTKSSYAALAFVSGEYGPAPRPNKTLVAYKKFHDIAPGARQKGTLGIKLAQLARFDAQGRRVLYPGTYRVAVDVDPEILSFEFELTGDAAVLEQWPAYDREAPPGF